MTTPFDFALPHPVRAKQHDRATCWATCTSVVLQANGFGSPPDEDTLVGKYGKVPGAGEPSPDDGQLSPDSLNDLARDFHYVANTFRDFAHAKALFTDEFIINILRTQGMFWAAPHLTTQDGFSWAHAQVVWGVNYSADADRHSDRAILLTMNPATGEYATFPLVYFYRLPMFSFWPSQRR